ncbi:MAG: thioredoxin family protein [Gemmataceae bacterium]|nr:thioredoxin family protein [Gemmataceae bacterium]
MTRIAAIALALAAGAAWAGKYNAKLSIGDAGPSFKGLPATDGKEYGLDDFKGKELVVLAVTCNHCPYAIDYEDRLIALAKKYEGKVAVVALSVGLGKEDRMDKMKERAKKKGFPFVYAHDETQAIGRALGAVATPEFVVLDKARKVAYLGALDDDDDPAKVKEKHLENALDALLAGKKPTVAETRAIGCAIEYKKK